MCRQRALVDALSWLQGVGWYLGMRLLHGVRDRRRRCGSRPLPCGQWEPLWGLEVWDQIFFLEIALW